MKEYRPWSPEQTFVLPPSPLEWLPEGHLANFILEIVEELDISAISSKLQEKDRRGERAYNPRMMLALLLYGYCRGVCSSRRIERATYEDVAFRVLAGGNQPHFTRISDFRQAHLNALSGLFLQVLKLCQKAGLVKLGHVALDGTKVQANASKHKAMSYERMQKSEQQLQDEIKGLLARAEATDVGEDAKFGRGRTPEDLPAELKRRELRLKRIRAAKAELEHEAAESRARELTVRAVQQQDLGAEEKAQTLLEKAKQLVKHDDQDPPSPSGTTPDGLAMHNVPHTADGRPEARAQRNFVDPDSRLMQSGGSFVQAYNCQLAVDEGHQIIIGQAVTNHPTDNRNLVPMLRLAEKSTGERIQTATADAGYWHKELEGELSAVKVDAYVATRRKVDAEPTVVTTDTPLARMRAKVATPQGRSIYARRKAVVEPVNGQIKEARGFRRFHLRGLSKVMGEWSLVCTCHNLLKLFSAGRMVLAPL